MPKASHVDIYLMVMHRRPQKGRKAIGDPTNKTNPSLVDIYGIMDTNDKFTVYHLVYFCERLRATEESLAGYDFSLLEASQMMNPLIYFAAFRSSVSSHVISGPNVECLFCRSCIPRVARRNASTSIVEL